MACAARAGGLLSGRFRRHRHAARARPLDRSSHQPRGLRFLDEAAQILDSRLATLGNTDGLLHAEELAVEDTGSRVLRSKPDEPLPHSRQRFHLSRGEQLDGRVAARRADELAWPEAATRAAVVYRPG